MGKKTQNCPFPLGFRHPSGRGPSQGRRQHARQIGKDRGVVPEISSRTNRHTDRHAHHNTSQLRRGHKYSASNANNWWNLDEWFFRHASKQTNKQTCVQTRSSAYFAPPRGEVSGLVQVRETVRQSWGRKSLWSEWFVKLVLIEWWNSEGVIDGETVSVRVVN